ncbi:hypothetical protein D3C87_1048780 [compost metagenome]
MEKQLFELSRECTYGLITSRLSFKRTHAIHEIREIIESSEYGKLMKLLERYNLEPYQMMRDNGMYEIIFQFETDVAKEEAMMIIDKIYNATMKIVRYHDIINEDIDINIKENLIVDSFKDETNTLLTDYEEFVEFTNDTYPCYLIGKFDEVREFGILTCNPILFYHIRHVGGLYRLNHEVDPCKDTINGDYLDEYCDEIEDTNLVIIDKILDMLKKDFYEDLNEIEFRKLAVKGSYRLDDINSNDTNLLNNSNDINPLNNSDDKQNSLNNSNKEHLLINDAWELRMGYLCVIKLLDNLEDTLDDINESITACRNYDPELKLKDLLEKQESIVETLKKYENTTEFKLLIKALKSDLDIIGQNGGYQFVCHNEEDGKDLLDLGCTENVDTGYFEYPTRIALSLFQLEKYFKLYNKCDL